MSRISLEVERLVQHWMEKFSQNYRTRTAAELTGLAQEWTRRLSRFKPSQVETALSLAYDESERFPSFAQIRKRIPVGMESQGGCPVECPFCMKTNPVSSTYKGLFCSSQCEQDFEPDRLAGLEIWRQFKRDRPDLFAFTGMIERAKKLPAKGRVGSSSDA